MWWKTMAEKWRTVRIFRSGKKPLDALERFNDVPNKVSTPKEAMQVATYGK